MFFLFLLFSTLLFLLLRLSRKFVILFRSVCLIGASWSLLRFGAFFERRQSLFGRFGLLCVILLVGMSGVASGSPICSVFSHFGLVHVSS